MKNKLLFFGIVLGCIYSIEFFCYTMTDSRLILITKFLTLIIYIYVLFESFSEKEYRKLLLLTFKASLAGGIFYVIFYQLYISFIDTHYLSTIIDKAINQSVENGQDRSEVIAITNKMIKYRLTEIGLLSQVVFQNFMVSLIVAFFYSKEKSRKVNILN